MPRLLLLLLFLGIFNWGCHKDPKITKATQQEDTSQYLHCLVYGQHWKPDIDAKGKEIISAVYTVMPYPYASEFDITAYRTDENGVKTELGMVFYGDLYPKGVYSDSTNAIQFSFADFYYHHQWATVGDTGQLIITVSDTVNKILAGTFRFYAHPFTPSSGPIYGEEGKFRVRWE